MKIPDTIAYPTGLDYVMRQMDAEQEFLRNNSDIEREHYLPFDAGIKPGMQVFAKRLGVIAISPVIVLSRWTGIDAALGFPSWHPEA